MVVVVSRMLKTRVVRDATLNTRARLAIFHGSSVSAEDALSMDIAEINFDVLMRTGVRANNLLTAGLQSQAGNFQSSLQRILESVKFELDVRGSMSQKHMEAVREEMSSGMQEAERRCLDISRQVDTAVGVRLDTERQLREATERTVQRLQEGIAEQHKESLRVVGDFQATALDHSEAPRRAQSGRLGGATAGHHGPTRRRPKALGCPSWLVRRHAAARQMPPRGRFTSEPDHRPRTHRPRRARLTVCLTVVRLAARRCCAGSSRSCSRSSSRPRRS